MTVQLTTDIRVFMQEYFDAWKEGELDKILSYYSDDVILNVIGGSGLLEGKTAVTENFVLPLTKGFPGNVHKVQNFINHGNQVVVEWLFAAVHKGDFAGIPPTGKTVNLPGCSVYTVEGGKITAGNLYLNLSALLTQLGVTGSVQ